MNVITIESNAYENIMNRLAFLETEIKKAVRNSNYPLSERWLDNEMVCKILNCSKRTLQMYRDEFMLPFSQIKHRMYYRADDVEKFLKDKYRIKEFTGRRRKCGM